MSYYNQPTYNRPTSLGLPEPIERAGSYAFLWVSGLLLLLFEKNPNVRHHARQSVLVFGTLGVLGLMVGFLHLFLGWIWVVGPLLALLGNIIWSVTGILWVVLMIAGAVSPRFTLPGTRAVQRALL